MAKLSSVRVEGFRLFEDIDIAIEPDTTVIVGRSNSGKTLLTEVFDKFLGEHFVANRRKTSPLGSFRRRIGRLTSSMPWI